MHNKRVAQDAEKLTRKIYASLPFKYRVAKLLFTLKIASYADTYGRVFYAEFIKAGVTGMPPVSGQPAEDLQEVLIKKGNRAASLLPIGYGGKFSREVWALTKKQLGAIGTDDNTADVLQGVIADMLGGSQQPIKKVSLASAESFIKKKVVWRAQDFKKRMRTPTDSLTDTETYKQIDLMDENALKKFMHILGPRGQRRFIQLLRSVDNRNPDRPWSWISAQLEGMTGREIAEEWGVTPALVTQWVDKYLPRIQSVFKDLLQESRTASFCLGGSSNPGAVASSRSFNWKATF